MNTGCRIPVNPRLHLYFANKPEVCFAYIFGSVARGTDGKLSDIDLAVFLDPLNTATGNGYGYKSDMLLELKELLSREVDLVILNDASTILRHQVLKNGILVYCRSETARRNFHENTVISYLDLKPLLKVQDYYMRKRLKEGTFGGESIG